MATKRDPFKDNTEVDNDWEIDDNFEEFESDFENVKTPKAPKSKARKAIETIGTYGTDALEGVSDVSRKALENVIRKNMPNTYNVANQAMGVVDEFSNVKADIMKSIGPVAQQTKQLWRNVSPKLSKMLPDKLSKKLDELAKEDQTEEQKQQSEQERRTQYINEAVANALKIQNKQEEAAAEEQRFNTLVDRKIKEKQHKSTLEALSGIYRESEYATEFFKSTVSGYFNQSLKLKFESLFISKDILATLQVMSKSFDEKLEGILKNSSLPDIQKQKLSESYREASRSALMKKVSEKIHNTVSNIGSRVVKNFGKKIQSGLGTVGDMLSMGNQASEMNDMMGQFGGENEPSKNMMAQMAVSEAAGWGFKKLANKYINKIDPKKRKKMSELFKGLASKPEAVLNDFESRLFLKLNDLDQNRESATFKDTLGGKAKVGLTNLLLDLVGMKETRTDVAENKLSKDPFAPTPYDIATRQSIVEIIPRYLANILKQVTEFNTGEKTEELVYDERSRDLVTASKYREDMIEKMHGKVKDRRGIGFARAHGSLMSALENHAETDRDVGKFQFRLKNFRSDIETIIKNHAVNVLTFHPEFIKIYAQGASDDVDISTEMNAYSYCNKIFKGIDKDPSKDKSQSKAVASLLVSALYKPDGSVNSTVVSELESSILNLMKDDSYKNELQKLLDSGKGHLFKDHLKQRENRFNDGDFTVDTEKVIDTYKRDYSVEDNDKLAAAYYKRLKKKLGQSGVAIEDVIDILPKSIQKYARKHISEETRKKKRFTDQVYGNYYKEIDDSYFKRNTNKNVEDIDLDQIVNESKSRKKKKRGGRYKGPIGNAYVPGTISSRIENKGPVDVNVISTKGEHVLIPYLDNIYKSIKEYGEFSKSQSKNVTINQTDIPVDKENKTDKVLDTLNIIKDTLITQVANLELWRQEFKSASMTQMSLAQIAASGAPAPQSVLQKITNSIKEFSTVKAAGSIIGGTAKGLGYAMGGASKGMWGFAKAVTPASFKAMGTVLSGLLRGSGAAVSGIAKGAGYLGGGLLKAHGKLASAALRGGLNAAGKVGSGLLSGLGYLFGKPDVVSNSAVDLGNKLSNLKGKSKSFIDDVFISGLSKPIITKQNFIDGIYEKMDDGKTRLISSIEDLKKVKGDIVNNSGEYIASANQFVNGLFDKNGKKLTNKLLNLKSKATDTVSKANGLKGIGRTALGKLAGGLGSAAGWLGKNAIGMPGTPMNALMHLGFDAVKWGGKTIGTLAHRLLGIDKNDGKGGSGISKKILEKLVTTRLDKMIKLMEDGALGGKPKVFGDMDDDGDREGSYADYVQKRKEEKEARERKREASKKDKDINVKDTKDKDDDSIFGKLLGFLPGGKKILGLFKKFGKGLGGLFLSLFKKLKGVKSIFGLLALLLGGGLFGNMKDGLMNMLGLGGGDIAKKAAEEATKKAAEAAAKKGALKAAPGALGLAAKAAKAAKAGGALGLAAKAAKAGGSLALKGAAAGAGLFGFKKLGSKLAEKATAIGVSSASKVGEIAASKAGGKAAEKAAEKAAGKTGIKAAEAAADAGKNGGKIVECLTWLKGKLPSSWGKHIDKIIKVISKIVGKLSVKALGKIIAKLISGPLGWGLMIADMTWEAGKATWDPQKLLGVPQSVSIDWSDRFLIGVAAAIGEGVFCGLVPTPFLAEILGVDVSKYIKDYEAKLDERSAELETMAEEAKKKDEDVKQSEGLQNTNQSGNLNVGTVNQHLQEKHDVFVKKSQAIIDTIISGSSNVKSNASLSVPSSSAATASQYGDASDWSSHYKPGSLKLSDTGNINQNTSKPAVQQQTTQSNTSSSTSNTSGSLSLPSAQQSSGGNQQTSAQFKPGAWKYSKNKLLTGKIGDMTMHEESGDKGPLDVSWDKTGGTSYGSYQFAAKPGGTADFLKWCVKNGGEFGKKLAADMNAAGPLETGSTRGAAPDVWKRYAAIDGGRPLHVLEFKYQLSVYNRALNKVLFGSKCGSPKYANEIRSLINGNKALQEAFWSTVVQHGIGGGPKIFARCYKPGISAKDYLIAVYAARSGCFGSSTGNVQASVKGRFKRELNLLLTVVGENGMNAETAGGGAEGIGSGGSATPNNFDMNVGSGSASTPSGNTNTNASGNLGGGTASPSSGSFMDRAQTSLNNYVNNGGKVPSGSNVPSVGSSGAMAGAAAFSGGVNMAQGASAGGTGDAPQNGQQMEQAAAGAGNDVVKRAIQAAYKQANSGATYSQPKRMGPMNYDCSSFVGRAYQSAGVNMPRWMPATSGMKEAYTKRGFKWIPCNPDKKEVRDKLLPGDVLVAPGKHTEMYLGNNKIIGARNTKPAPRGIGLISYFNDGYSGVLRYGNGGAGLSGTPESATQSKPDTSTASQYGGMDVQPYQPGAAYKSSDKRGDTPVTPPTNANTSSSSNSSSGNLMADQYGGLGQQHYTPGSLNLNGNKNNNTAAPAGATAGQSSNGNVNMDQFANIKPVSVSGGDKIGAYTAKFESGKEGAASISWDSTGGTSYGTYQLAAKTGVFKDFIKVIQSSSSPNKDVVLKMMATVKNWDVGKNWKGTDAANVWKMMASKGLIQEFEHEFTMRRYKQVMSNFPQDLQEAINKSRGLQEMLWSTVVQHGPGGKKRMNGATGIFLKCWKPGMQLDQFVKAVYASRSTKFGSSTPAVRKSVQNRFKEECGIILGIVGKGGIADGGGGSTPAAAPDAEAAKSGNLGGGTVGDSGSGGSSADSGSGSSTPDTSTASQYGGMDVQPYQPGAAYKSSDSNSNTNNNASSSSTPDTSTASQYGGMDVKPYKPGEAYKPSNKQGDAPQGGQQVDQAGANAGNDVVKKAIEIAHKQANSGATYNQPHRMDSNHFDCSSFVGRAYKAAGIDLPKWVPATSGMKEEYTKRGFKWIPCNPDKDRSQLLPGDILLAPGKHTEMYLGNDKIIGARNTKPAPRGIGLISYFKDGYSGVLRYGNGGAGLSGTPAGENKTPDNSGMMADQYGGMEVQPYKPGAAYGGSNTNADKGDSPTTPPATPSTNTSTNTGNTNNQGSVLNKDMLSKAIEHAKSEATQPGAAMNNPSNDAANMSKKDGSTNNAGANISQTIDKSGFTVKGGDFENVNPNVKARFAAMAKEYHDKTGKKMVVTSGKRSMEKQAALYKKLGPGLAAKPNPLAPHISGLALDVNYNNKSINEEAEKMGLFQKYGLYRPLKNGLGRTSPEHWHIEPIGSRDPNAGMKITQATLAKFGNFNPNVGSGDNKSTESGAVDNSADGVAANPVNPQQGGPGSDVARAGMGTGGGSMPDGTQSTGAGSTGMSTIPSGGGAGSATLNNMSSGSTGGSFDPNAGQSQQSNTPTAIDFTPLIDILKQANIYLEAISKNTTGMGDAAKAAAGTADPVATDVNKNRRAINEGPLGLNNDRVPTEIIGSQPNDLNIKRDTNRNAVLNTSRQRATSSHFF